MKKYVLMFFLLCFSMIIHNEVHASESIKGVYTIDQFPSNELLPLDGEWEFYWKKLYTPEDFQNNRIDSKPAYVKIPDGPNGFDLGNGENVSLGYGTYHLQIQFPKEEVGTVKALHLPSISTAYNLWVNGELIESNGKVGTSKETAEPQHLKKTAVFQVKSETMELVLQVSNFHQRKSGIFTSIYLGEYETVKEYREKALIFRSLIMMSFIIIGLYHLVLFLFHNSAKHLLFFSISVFFIALRTTMLEEPIANYLLPFLSWDVASKIEYLGFILGALFFAYFVFTQYPNEVSKKMLYFISIINITYSLFVIFASIYASSKTLILMELIGLITIIYILVINFLAFKRKRDNSTLNVIGTLILFAAGINDILFYNGYIHTIELASIALVFFIFTQAIIISRNYSKSFKKNEKYANELSVLNASLEEKVISRTNELNEANKQLFEANKKLTEVFESNKKLINNISHEIRSPLTTIQTYTKGMLDGVLEKDEKYLDLVYQKGVHLAKILDDLVSLSDLENDGIKFDFEKINVRQYFTNLYEKLKIDLDKKEIIFKFLDHLPDSKEFYFLIDQTRIEQVIVNLVNNAQRYIGEDGTIAISLNQNDEHHVIIGVEDNGIGIKETDLKYIFERFYSRDSQKSNYKGAGLGLTISKEIVERHNGTIWVESVYKEGAKFFIKLPLVKEEI